MNCPECHRPLVETELSEEGFVTVEICGGCGGCWLEEEAFDEQAWGDAKKMPVTEASALSPLSCPRCAIAMVAVNPADHRELTVEKCPSCHGFWLEKGELHALRDVAWEFTDSERGLPALDARPNGWSRFKWIAYRVADQLSRIG